LQALQQGGALHEVCSWNIRLAQLFYQQRHCSRTVQINVQQKVSGNCVQLALINYMIKALLQLVASY